jgi:hypothetical protein
MATSSRSLLLFVALVAVAAIALYPKRYTIWYALDPSAAPKPHPMLPVTTPFADAPPQLRAFFLQAKAADAIADPLARCLAFPDLPGTRWPAGLTQAQCQQAFGPRITLETLRDHFARGDFAGLDALFARDLERHFTEAHDEVIHRDYAQIGSHSSWDQFTQRWLQASPRSAYALAARGRYLEEAASVARGNRSAADTSRDAFRVMSGLAKQGIDHYRRALAIEPRLLPAHVGLIALAMLDGRGAERDAAIAAAAKVDPDCFGVAAQAAVALSPKWGGDARRQAAYLAQVAQAATRRPLLALVAAQPAIDAGDALYDVRDLAGSQAVLEEAAQRSSSPHVQADLARAMIQREPARAWEALALLIAASRYEAPHDWIASWVGLQLLSSANDPDWALAYLQRAAAQDPGNAETQQALANLHQAMETMRRIRQLEKNAASAR